MRIVWCQICTVPGRLRTLYGTLTLEFWNPAIPTGKHGESLDNMENVEKICDSKYSIHDSKQSICQPDQSKTLFFTKFIATAEKS